MIIELALIIVIIICIITEIIKYAYPDSVHLIRGRRTQRKQRKLTEAFEEKNMFNYNASNQRCILH